MARTEPGEVCVVAVQQSTGVRAVELAWKTRIELEDFHGSHSLAETAALQWYDETGQSGHAVVVLRVMDRQFVTSEIAVDVGPRVFARARWIPLTNPGPKP